MPRLDQSFEGNKYLLDQNSLMPLEKGYQATVRHFPDGQTEITTHRVRAFQRMASYYRNGAISTHLKIQEDSIKEGETPEEAIQRVLEEKEEKDRDNKNRAIRRARQKIRWIVKSAQFDHMITLTYRDNMQDVEQLKGDWKRFVRLVHAKYPEWSFIAIKELQERGALHLHIAVKGRQDIKYLRRCWYLALGSSPNVEGAETPGAINVRAPLKRWGGKGYNWRPDKLSGYLTKYLHKCFEISEHASKRYWTSKDVKIEEPQKIWLGATTFTDAIVETHDMIRAYGAEFVSMWASVGYDSIWISSC